MNRIELRGNEYFLNGKKLKYLKSISMKKTSEKESEVTLVIKATVQGKDFY
ncbi:hypothetical protein HGQ41_001135 [Enterococcus faecalis]|nr:hypothetical protein [Enterococcus faecalis]EGO5969166.1 hypothetical protein [Enterococcus faecalis]EHU9669819.1 hypothetical protein [Enterococcus faecalis]